MEEIFPGIDRKCYTTRFSITTQVVVKESTTAGAILRERVVRM